VRFANPSYTLSQLKELFERKDNLLGKGKQGVVVRSEDGGFAIKKQSLEPSEQEVQHNITPAGGAYMTARVGQEGLGPKVFQYEEDPAEGATYLVMENLVPAGYQSLKSIVNNEDAYKKLYAQQMMMEARAAGAGLNLKDTHNSENVMFHPETGDIKFIDQGFSRPYESARQQNLGQVLAAVQGLSNLDQVEKARAFERRLRSSAGGKIEDNEMASLAAEAVTALRRQIGGWS